MKTIKRYHPPDDALLIGEYQAGNRNSGMLLYDTHNNHLINSLWKLTRIKQTAEDFAQETWVKAFKILDSNKYVEQQKFFGWLFAIAKNTYRVWQRLQR